jgi:hypothetical protein
MTNKQTGINQHIAQSAFEYAIGRGVLSDKVDDMNYAGDYRYMGADTYGLAFRNIITRQYTHCLMTHEPIALGEDGLTELALYSCDPLIEQMAAEQLRQRRKFH